jgi:hypothetical protein
VVSAPLIAGFIPAKVKLLNRVRSVAQGDVEYERAAVFFQPGQKGSLDLRRGIGNTKGKEY